MIVELAEEVDAVELEVLLDLGLIVELEFIKFLETLYQIGSHVQMSSETLSRSVSCFQLLF